MRKIIDVWRRILRDCTERLGFLSPYLGSRFGPGPGPGPGPGLEPGPGPGPGPRPRPRSWTFGP